MADKDENKETTLPTKPITHSWVPTLATVGTLGVAGGLGFLGYRMMQKSKAESTPTPTPTPEPPSPENPPAPNPAPKPETKPANPGVVPPTFWGSTTRGEEFRELLTRIEQVSRMPLRLFLSVVANRESDFIRTARNTTKKEVDGSQAAITNGVKRGNTKPKFAQDLALAGSGGLFGALAPYVAWTGMDENYMPYLDESWKVIEDPVVAAVCAAKYYQRIVTFYPTVFAGNTPAPEDNFRVRLGWASPATLKDDPKGKLFDAVRGRMEEDLSELGLKITDLPPPDASMWPGLKAVVDGMKGLKPTWK